MELDDVGEATTSRVLAEVALGIEEWTYLYICGKSEQALV